MPDISDADLKALKDAAKAGEKAQALYDGLKVEYDRLKPLEARLPELEGQIKTFQAERLDSTFKAAGVTDPKVRRIFDLEYQDLQPEAGKEKPALGDWLTGLQALPADKRPAHLAPFLQAPAAANQTGTSTTIRTPANLPDATKGTQPIQGAGSNFTADAIEKMSPTEYRQNRDAILASTGINAPPLPAPPAPKA